jgi:hypothetical protein
MLGDIVRKNQESKSKKQLQWEARGRLFDIRRAAAKVFCRLVPEGDALSDLIAEGLYEDAYDALVSAEEEYLGVVGFDGEARLAKAQEQAARLALRALLLELPRLKEPEHPILSTEESDEHGD